MQMELLGTASVNFDLTHQLLTSAFLIILEKQRYYIEGVYQLFTVFKKRS
jgi:hypothetical protein